MTKMLPYSGGLTEVRSEHNRILALVLWWFLGLFGVHRFYVGRFWTGILWLLTGGLFGIGWVYDGVMLFLGRFEDGDGAILGPPQQRYQLADDSARRDPTKQLESDLQEHPDRDTPDVTKDEVERELERDPLEEKFDELERDFGRS